MLVFLEHSESKPGTIYPDKDVSGFCHFLQASWQTGDFFDACPESQQFELEPGYSILNKGFVLFLSRSKDIAG